MYPTDICNTVEAFPYAGTANRVTDTQDEPSYVSFPSPNALRDALNNNTGVSVKVCETKLSQIEKRFVNPLKATTSWFAPPIFSG